MTEEKIEGSPKKPQTMASNPWLRGDPELRVNFVAEEVQNDTARGDPSLRVEVKKDSRKSG